MYVLTKHLAWLTAVASASLLNAQIVVDPNGSGHYTDLQTAITAAPSGAVIRVLGGNYGPLTIDKSLTIMGDPAFRIELPEFKTGGVGWPNAQPDAVLLSGTGAEHLKLSHVVVQDQRVDGSLLGWNSAGSPIAGGGFAQVHIQDSTLHGPEWGGNMTGYGRSVPGVDLPTAPSVVLVRCDVRATDVYADYNRGPISLPEGEAGVFAPNADVVALDSNVEGGDAEPKYFNYEPAWPLSRGRGGDGIVAQRVFTVDTDCIGGTGMEIWVEPSPFEEPYFWNKMPDGNPVVADFWVQLPEAIYPTAPMQLGNPYEIRYAQPSLLPSVMLAGRVGSSPIAIGSQWLFLDVSFPMIAVGVPAEASSFTLTVPNVAALGGGDFGFQAWMVPPWVNLVRLSNPVLELIEF